MVSGYSNIFMNLMYFVGILLLLILILFLLGMIKAILETFILKNKVNHIFKKLRRIEKEATKTLKDFNDGARFMGLGEMMELGEEIEELEKILSDEQKKEV